MSPFDQVREELVRATGGRPSIAAARVLAALAEIEREQAEDRAEIQRERERFSVVADACRELRDKLAACERQEVKTLPIDVRGKWYEVPIPVQLHIIQLRDKLAACERQPTDEECERIAKAATMTMHTSVTFPEIGRHMFRAVREVMT